MQHEAAPDALLVCLRPVARFTSELADDVIFNRAREQLMSLRSEKYAGAPACAYEEALQQALKHRDYGMFAMLLAEWEFFNSDVFNFNILPIVKCIVIKAIRDAKALSIISTYFEATVAGMQEEIALYLKMNKM